MTEPKKLLHILMHIGRLLKQQIGDELAPLKLQHGQARTLVFLLIHGKITQANLARGMEVKPATITRMLKPLEARNLIWRKTDEKTNRAVVVGLTPEGEELALQSQEAWERVEAELLEAMLPGESAQLFGQLEAFRNQLGGSTPEIIPYEKENTP
jgi:DNA-binding MarR family transcriptional regulator